MPQDKIDKPEDKKIQLILAMESLNNNPDGVFWLDSFHGRFIYVNDQACEKLGYTREELLTMTTADIDPTPPSEDTWQGLDLVNDKSSKVTTHMQTMHRHKSGYLIPVEISITFNNIEGLLYASCIVRDITDRILAENQLRETYARLSVLYDIYRVTTKELDIDLLITETCNLLQKTLNYDALTFYLLDEDKREVVLSHAVGLSEEILDIIKTLTKDVEAINAMFNKENTYLRYKIPSEDNLMNLMRIEGFTDVIEFPIMADNRFIGRIILINKFNKPIDLKDQELLKAICRQLSTVLQNAKLYISLKNELEEHTKTEIMLKEANEELERIASTDQLTNLWNRRYFFSVVQIEIERAKRHKQTMSLLLFDIDHFKNVNDKFGHQVGDSVLVNFAKVLRNNMRSLDLLARWGGEEFLILAPQLGVNEAMQLAERLRKTIAEHSFSIAGSITVSIGIAEFCHNDTLDLWITKADDALYCAKKQGRNRVEMCHDTNSEQCY